MSETAPLTTPIRLKMGSDVPEWLIVAEPMQPGAPRGNFRFAVDVDIMETPEYFLINPIMEPGGTYSSVIDNSGMGAHRVYAPGKPVVQVNACTTWYPSNVVVWHTETESEHPAAPKGHFQPPSVPVNPRAFGLPGTQRCPAFDAPSRPTQPGLFRRLWWAVAGR